MVKSRFVFRFVNLYDKGGDERHESNDAENRCYREGVRLGKERPTAEGLYRGLDK